MNGEMHQICMLVSQARNAMAGKNEFEQEKIYVFTKKETKTL